MRNKRSSVGLAMLLLAAAALLAACEGGDSAVAGGAPDAVPAGCPVALGVGYQVVQFSGGPKAAVWYPTVEAERPFAYASDTAGSVALNATPATCEQFPVVVFSHGFGGCGLQSLFITESLARRGYVVIAPDHADALCRVDGNAPSGTTVQAPSLFDPSSWNDTSYADRRDDVRAVLGSLAVSPWAAQIDASRIGLIGHSLGGYTAAGLAGAWPTWKDVRVRAAVLLSPYVVPYQLQRTLGAIQGVPLMYQGAQFDVFITPSLEEANGAYAVAQPPKYYVKLFLGSHFEWTNLVCAGTPTIADCLRARSNAGHIVNYTAAFLDQHVKGVPAPLLAQPGTGLAQYLAQPN